MSAGSARRAARWDRAVAEHRAAVERILGDLARVPPERWSEPCRGQGWSPAQVAEHLALTYQALLTELAGQGGMRPAVGARLQRVLRWFLLPHILFHRSFPLRARAPRELRPGERGLGPEEWRPRLVELARQWEQAALSARTTDGLTLHHPYFGRVPLLHAFRFVTVHLEHHRRQLAHAGLGGTGA